MNTKKKKAKIIVYYVNLKTNCKIYQLKNYYKLG